MVRCFIIVFFIYEFYCDVLLMWKKIPTRSEHIYVISSWLRINSEVSMKENQFQLLAQ